MSAVRVKVELLVRPALLVARDRLGAVGLGRGREGVGARAAGAGEGEAGEGGEGVGGDAGLAVARRGGDVEGAAAGGAVEGGGAGGVHGGARIGEHQAGGGRVGCVDLDDGGDRGRVADVVGAGEGVAVAAGGEAALGGGADERGGGAVGRTGVSVERALLAGQDRGVDTGACVGVVVGAQADGERAVAVVAVGSAAVRAGPVHGQRAAGRRGRVGRQREVRRARIEQRLVAGGDGLVAVRLGRRGEGVGAGGAGAGAGEAGERREAVVEDAGLGVGRARR